MSKSVSITVNVPIRPLALVCFSYPSKASSKKLTGRYVKVTEFDGEALRGFEVDPSKLNDQGKYKVFLAHRIAGAVHLVRQEKLTNGPEVKVQ